MGAPQISIDRNLVTELVLLGCPVTAIASTLQVHRHTLANWSKREHGKTFAAWAREIRGRGPRRGPQPKPINWQLASTMAEAHCKVVSICARLNVSRTVFEGAVKREFGVSLPDWLRTRRESGTDDLRLAEHEAGLRAVKDARYQKTLKAALDRRLGAAVRRGVNVNVDGGALPMIPPILQYELEAGRPADNDVPIGWDGLPIAELDLIESEGEGKTQYVIPANGRDVVPA